MSLTSANDKEVPPGLAYHRPGEAGYLRVILALFAAGVATFAALYTTQPVRGHHRAWPRRRPRRDRAGRTQDPLMRAADEGAWPVAALVAILAVTIAVLIALALVLSTVGLCAQTWPLLCNGR